MRKSRNWFSWSKSTPPNTDAFIVFLFWWERNQRDRVKKVMKRIKLCRSAAMGGARQVAGELIIGALESICRSSIYLLPSTLYHRHLPPPLDSSNSCCRLPKLGKLRDKGPVLLRGLSIKSSHRVNLSQFPKSRWPVNSNPHPYWPEKTASPLTQGD